MPYTQGQLQKSELSGLLYRLRQPHASKPGKCVILLHGVGGNESNLAGLADTFDNDTLVVFARAPHAIGPGQFAWFPVMFSPSGPKIDAEKAESSRQQLIRFVDEIQHIHAVSPQHSILAGFSQGGIMSASVALSAPEQLAGFGLLSGRILPELEPVIASGERLSTLQGFIGHGEQDSKLPVDWAHKADQWLSRLGVSHTLHTYPIDHTISPEMRDDFVRWTVEIGL
jgi:phospholipase/carboxylesterase